MDAPARQIALAHSAGSCAPVVWLHTSDQAPAAAALLAQHFRVLVFTIAHTTSIQDDAIANAIRPHASEPVGLIADASSAPAALQLAAARPDLVQALALLAPMVPDNVSAS